MEPGGRASARLEHEHEPEPERSGGDASCPAPFQRGQRHQLAMLEDMAQSLVEAALDEALECYLRRQLQPMADETIRVVLAAATGGEL